MVTLGAGLVWWELADRWQIENRLAGFHSVSLAECHLPAYVTLFSENYLARTAPGTAHRSAVPIDVAAETEALGATLENKHKPCVHDESSVAQQLR